MTYWFLLILDQLLSRHFTVRAIFTPIQLSFILANVIPHTIHQDENLNYLWNKI